MHANAAKAYASLPSCLVCHHDCMYLQATCQSALAYDCPASLTFSGYYTSSAKSCTPTCRRRASRNCCGCCCCCSCSCCPGLNVACSNLLTVLQIRQLERSHGSGHNALCNSQRDENPNKSPSTLHADPRFVLPSHTAPDTVN